MARGDQLYRQWALLIELSRGRKSRRELSESLGVSLRTIKRDIDALSRFPLREEQDGIDIFYSCSPGFRLPNIALSSRERMALIIGKRTVLKALEGAPFKKDVEAALAKVELIQQDSTQRRLRNLPEVFLSHFARPQLRTTYQPQLVEAAMSGRRVWIRYFTAGRQAVSERVVEPHFVYLHPRGTTLIAYCLKRDAFLNFNVNLIRALRVLDETFSPTSRSFDLDAYLADGFDGHRSAPIIDVHLRISPPTASWARDQFFHPSQQITEGHSGVIEVTFRAGGSEAIAARVCSLGPDCEVLSPSLLQEMVAQRAAQIVALYKKSEKNHDP